MDTCLVQTTEKLQASRKLENYTRKKNVTGSPLAYIANVNSSITDKLRYLSVISKQTHIFSNICECYYNHRQMSVKMKMKYDTQQKTEKFLSLWKKLGETATIYL